MNIKIYSTPTCPYCIQAKEYFKGKNIPFEDFNVAENKEKAEEMVKLSGQMGVPVIKIDAPEDGISKIIVGFDRDEIEKLVK